ncbi:hypothetical protein E1J24_15655 [Xanthomonas hortorum pv. pelargonii]|uniref:Uncharacterized protein n=1 Tax=Xanthomonas hortorum pv. pelargonii TaxID=453602 RepID=A0AAW9ZTM9_9XANT|nr:hypothetical protein [Xanthomonas hortorum pv. pelargonii]
MGPYAAGMPHKRLQGRTCGVSHAGTRASTLSGQTRETLPTDVSMRCHVATCEATGTRRLAARPADSSDTGGSCYARSTMTTF